MVVVATPQAAASAACEYLSFSRRLRDSLRA